MVGQRARFIGVFLTLILLMTGCASTGHVSADGLTVKRVVVYRNGVAYFERQGKVEGDRVTFRVRPSHVDDFLASLAVTARSDTKVKSASFTQAKRGKRNAVKVTLSFNDGDHDLRVRYVAATPVWKPTYRLIMEGDKLHLQAWGIVYNLSGEDWKNVQLSLVAGAPISFEATLGTPVTPQRPVITDSGEVVSRVPTSHTKLALRPKVVRRPKIAPAKRRVVTRSFLARKRRKKRSTRRWRSSKLKPGRPRFVPRRRRFLRGGRKVGRVRPPTPTSSRFDRFRAVRRSAAAVTVRGGLTRYDIPQRITLPNRSATMVALVSKPVPGALIYLFAPDRGVSASFRHPFHVVRFKNDTAGLLERGPVTITKKNTFLGQGVTEPIPAGATVTIPFALERGLAVGSSLKTTYEGARIAQITAGKLILERDTVYRTTYRIQNGMGKAAQIMVKHALKYGTKLHKPPKGTERKTGKREALIPFDAPARSVSKHIVEERRGYRTARSWFSALANKAVSMLLKDTKVSASVRDALRAAWPLRNAIMKASAQIRILRREKATLVAAQRETRANIKALGKDKRTAKLKKKLVARLATYTTRLTAPVKKEVAIQSEASAAHVRFKEALRKVSYIRKR